MYRLIAFIVLLLASATPAFALCPAVSTDCPNPTFNNLTVGGTAVISVLQLNSLNNTPIGATTPSTGAFTTLTSTSFSTNAINSTPIGATTPSTGAFTTLLATGATTLQGNTSIGIGGTNNVFSITPGSTTSTAIALGQSGSGGFTLGGALSISGLGPVTAFNGTWNPGNCATEGSTTNQFVDGPCGTPGAVTGSGSLNQIAAFSSTTGIGGVNLGSTLALNASGTTLNAVMVDTVHTASATLANIGGQDDFNKVSSITGTVPASSTFSSGSTFIATNQNTGALSVNFSTNSITAAGVPLSGSNGQVDQYGFMACSSSATGIANCFGFPGYGTITSGALAKFNDAFGGFTAGDLTGDTTTSASLVTTTTKVRGITYPSSVTTGQQLYASSASVITSALPKDEYVWTVPSNIAIANGTTTIESNFPWATGTITSVDYGTNGTSSPGFTAGVQIGGVNVTSCNALSVTSSTNTNVACTAANALVSTNVITVVISGVTGSPAQGWIKVNFTRSVN